ncbi:MAG: transketolase [Patescibacteria group bacterium]
MIEAALGEDLFGRAKHIRRDIVEMIYRAKSSHIGCALSAADILTALYFGGVLRIDPKSPKAPGRDRLILSKGHAVTAVYAALAERGFFPKEKLLEYGTDGTTLASHIVLDVLPGTETSSGSGGHGLPMGVGMALAARADKNGARIFVLSGDGELEEGSAWEAMLFAGHHKLSNLKLIVDRNDLQDGVDGLRVSDVLDLNPLDEKFRAFGWEVDIVDGHDPAALIPALKKETARPHAIIAKTVKGKGVSFMENRGEWHGKCPNADEYAIAIKELS